MPNYPNAYQLEEAAATAAKISSFAFVVSLAADHSGCTREDLLPALELLSSMTRDHELAMKELDNSTDG